MWFCIALAATILLCISDIAIWWKALAAALYVASYLLPSDGVLFVIPLVLQFTLIIWGIAYWGGPPLRG